MKKKRPVPTIEWETQFGYPGRIIVGVDEVGRGCLAGPVVAGAVILPSSFFPGKNPWITEVADSKLLSPEQRAELAPKIREWALASAIGVASVAEIDRINIHHASHLAMARAIEGLGIPVQHVLVDGKFAPKNLGCAVSAIVKGDQLCLSVAAASIIAKVWRDEHMAELEARYPGYGFAAHKGYSTPVHLRALKALGPCEEHRQGFAPVAALLKKARKKTEAKKSDDSQLALLI